MGLPGGFVVSSREPSSLAAAADALPVGAPTVGGEQTLRAAGWGGDPADGDGGVVPVFPVAAAASQVVAFLESLVVADLSDNDLVEVVAGWAQVAGMVVAHQAAAIAELQARATSMREFVNDELACALVTTRAAVDVLANRAAGIAAYPVLADALMAGTVDARKVDVILAETLSLAFEPERAQAIGDCVDAAKGLTGTQLQRHVRRHVLQVDPKVAKKRAAAARQDRCVRLEWANDSMARLVAFIPAPDAVAAFTVLDALAGTTGSGDVDGNVLDRRDVDQRRADAFSDIFTTIIDTEHTPNGTVVPRKHGQRVALNVTVAATTLLGLDEHPGELAGYGPIPASMARELAQQGTWRRILTDPATGEALETGTRTYRPGADLTRTIQARDVTCTWPGCRQPATRSEIDHITPYRHSQPAASATPAPAPATTRMEHPKRGPTTCTPCVNVTIRPRPASSGTCDATSPPATPSGPAPSASPTRAHPSPCSSHPAPTNTDHPTPGTTAHHHPSDRRLPSDAHLASASTRLRKWHGSGVCVAQARGRRSGGGVAQTWTGPDLARLRGRPAKGSPG